MWILTGILLWVFLTGCVLLGGLWALSGDTEEPRVKAPSFTDNDPFSFLFE